MAEPKQLKIVYTEAAAKQVIAATGAFGGPAPDGASVVVQLYVESSTIPTMHIVEANQEGEVDLRSGEVIRRGDLTREVQATLVMSPDNAESLGNFLIQNAQLAKTRKTT